MLKAVNRGTSPFQFISINYSPISLHPCIRSYTEIHIDMIMKASLIINSINSLLFIIKLFLLSSDPIRALLPNRMDCSLGRSNLIIHSISSLSNMIEEGYLSEWYPISTLSSFFNPFNLNRFTYLKLLSPT